MKKIGLIIIILSVFSFSLDSCLQFRVSKSEIDNYLVKRKSNGIQVVRSFQDQEIHYLKSGKEDGPLVFFVHGSPGSLHDFIDFVTDTILQKKANLITADRPGFGENNFGNGEPSLERQSAFLKQIIEENKNGKPVILVGHSLGGPLIARMALDYPELIDGLIFVAASVDPKLEPANWWRTPFAKTFLRWLLPRSIRASNDEIFPLRKELEELLPKWKDIHTKTTVIHGTKDSLVPFGNSEFLQTQLSHTKPMMMIEVGMDHFVPWSHPYLIRKAIEEMIGMDP
jgi:pimeloyl-ACP methyl ester carboxylesterase